MTLIKKSKYSILIKSMYFEYYSYKKIPLCRLHREVFFEKQNN